MSQFVQLFPFKALQEVSQNTQIMNFCVYPSHYMISSMIPLSPSPGIMLLYTCMYAINLILIAAPYMRQYYVVLKTL